VLAPFVERRGHVHSLLKRILNHSGALLCSLGRPD
jgi:hypothetical protein